MISLKQISNKIVALKNNSNFLIVAVCGAADLGKTYLSAQLVEVLSQMELTAGLLTLDSYMMNRTDRIKEGISGYQPKAYDLLAVKKDLIKFKNAEPIDFFPYDHCIGQQVFQKETLVSCDILLLDGLHSMNDELASLIDFSIFLCTDDAQLKEIRHKADIKKRKQSIKFSNENAAVEFENYKHFVEPYKNLADVVLLLKEQWKYSLIVRE
jgi:uridine kinase